MDFGYPGYKKIMLDKKAIHQTYKTSKMMSKYNQKSLELESINKSFNLLQKKNKMLYNKNKKLKSNNKVLIKKISVLKANLNQVHNYYSSLLDIERSKRIDLNKGHDREIVSYQFMIDNLNKLISRKQEFNDWETIEMEDL